MKLNRPFTGLINMWDKQARFTTLVNALADDLYRYACWLCRDRDKAEDLVQETFTRAWKSLHSLKDEKAAKSWLITILRREYAREFERQRPEIADIDYNDLADSKQENDTSTEAFVLRASLARLANEYREPLVLQVIYGYSCEEIGELLGLGKGAVMSRVFRARQMLRATLTDEKIMSKRAKL